VRSRDFTINTLLVDLNQPEEVLDLLGGLDDLRDKRLRAASEQSLQLDPLRVLRGIRFCENFQLEVVPETRRPKCKKLQAGLAKSSGERIRDELFKTLALGKAAEAFEMMDTLGALMPVFPELAALRQQPALFSACPAFVGAYAARDHLPGRTFESTGQGRIFQNISICRQPGDSDAI